MMKHIAESDLCIPPQKDGYFALFVNSFQAMHLLRLWLLVVLMTGTTLILFKLLKTQRSTEMPCDLPNKEARAYANFKAGETNESRTTVGGMSWESNSAAVCTLEERGLHFTEDNEQFGFPNNSNYLNLFELVAKFDPFLLAQTIEIQIRKSLLFVKNYLRRDDSTHRQKSKGIKCS